MRTGLKGQSEWMAKYHQWIKNIWRFSACLEPKISTSYLFSGFIVTIFHLRNFISSLISFLVYHKLPWHGNWKWLMLFLCPLKMEMARQKHRLDFHCSGSLSEKNYFFFFFFSNLFSLWPELTGLIELELWCECFV